MLDVAAPPRYLHTQPGHTVRISLLASVGLLAWLAFVVPRPEGAEPWPQVLCLGTAGFLLLATILFGSLTIAVTEDALRWHFGPGLVSKGVALSDIASCRPVRTSFWNGWGIHWSPRGWVYNVSGFGAVEVTLKSGKAFRLGTDEPDALAQAIEQALAS